MVAAVVWLGRDISCLISLATDIDEQSCPISRF